MARSSRFVTEPGVRDIVKGFGGRYAVRGRAESDRVTARAGDSTEVAVHARSFRRDPQDHRIEVHAPPVLTAEPGRFGCVVPAESRTALQGRIAAAPDADPGVRIVVFDVTRNGRRLG